MPASRPTAPVATFAYPESAARALGRAAERAEWLRRPAGTVPGARRHRRRTRPRRSSPGARAVDDAWLAPAQARELLAAYGIPLVAERVVADADDAVEAARELGFPVVVKSAARRARTRPRRGGVALDLARRGCGPRGRRADRHARCSSSRWSRAAPSCWPASSRIRSFGPLVAFGPGGVFAELIGEARFPDRAAHRRRRGGARPHREGRAGSWRGFRGAPPADAAALVDLLHRLVAARRRPPRGRRARPEPGHRAPRRLRRRRRARARPAPGGVRARSRRGTPRAGRVECRRALVRAREDDEDAQAFVAGEPVIGSGRHEGRLALARPRPARLRPRARRGPRARRRPRRRRAAAAGPAPARRARRRRSRARVTVDDLVAAATFMINNSMDP